MGGIIIAGVEFNVDAPVKNWHETGWDATIENCVQSQGGCGPGGIAFGKPPANPGTKRYALRPQLRSYGMHPPLEAVKALLNQFIFHHDGCSNSAMCWQVLHNERGLSCHFLVDNDGVIYQTIDLAFMAYHAAEFNIPSIGVEISNRGEAAKAQDYYTKLHQKRDITTCTINNSKILTFAFTKEQMTSMRALCLALQRLLPNIPIEYPQSAPGQQSWGTLLEGGRETGAFHFKGYMGHYHCTQRKWDPGPFDFKDFCEKLRGQRCFPLWTGKADPQKNDRPLVPDDGTALKDALTTLYAMNEQKSEGGFFPVGPWGQDRLWHGGVHMASKEKAPIWSPFAGRIVAARMGKSSPYGSVNFVLVRHDMTVGDVTMRFFALYMHVYDETKETDETARPIFMKKDSWQKVIGRAKLDEKERNKVWDDSVSVGLIDEPVEAGEIVARVGRAGPDNKGQIHFEIFSEDEILPKFPGAKVEKHDGSGMGRFVSDADIVTKIDTDPKDGKLSRREILGFFQAAGERDNFRMIQAQFITEWTAEPDWSESLKSSTDFRTVKPADIDEMVAEQITPALWWTDKVADHCKLPADGLVYHYNPIDFIGFLNQRIQEAALTAPPPQNPTDTKGAGGPPAGVTDDNVGDDGSHSITLAQTQTEDPCDKLRLEDFVQGYQSGADCNE